MKFTVSSSALNSKLQALSKVLNSKPVLQILDNFLFEVTDGVLYVTASDGENLMSSSLKVDSSDSNGRFIVNNRTILDATRELADQPMQFEVDLSTFSLTVEYQNGKYNFSGYSASDYPAIKELEPGFTTVKMENKSLFGSIQRSLFAVAQDELRPVMNGLYFDLSSSEGISIVASDGHKLVKNTSTVVKPEGADSFILPKKPATLLRNTLQNDDSEVEISFDNNRAEIRYADTLLSCRLIEGKYPGYNAVIPTDNPNQITIDRKGLIGVLRRVLPFSSTSSGLIRFHVEMGRLDVSSEDVDFSTSAKESILCEYTGMPINIGFKGTNFNEILNNLDADDVVIKLSDPSRAGVIVPAEQNTSTGEEVLMLVMPMLLNE